jgi:hypothetical protein
VACRLQASALLLISTQYNKELERYLNFSIISDLIADDGMEMSVIYFISSSLTSVQAARFHFAVNGEQLR